MPLIRGLFWGNQIVMSWVPQFNPAILPSYCPAFAFPIAQFFTFLIPRVERGRMPDTNPWVKDLKSQKSHLYPPHIPYIYVPYIYIYICISSLYIYVYSLYWGVDLGDPRHVVLGAPNQPCLSLFTSMQFCFVYSRKATYGTVIDILAIYININIYIYMYII